MKTRYYYIGLLFLLFAGLASCSKDGAPSMSESSTTGKGGSMARFTIIGDYMYVIDNRELKVFDITDPAQPDFVNSVDIGFGIETIWPYGKHVFIGSNNGMHIYNIDQPDNPVFVSDFAHVMSCDPVVVEDSIAYVTLRSGGDCRLGWTADQIDIIDVHNLQQPELIHSEFVDPPYGLGIDGDHLFVCHGAAGLSVWDVSNLQNLQKIMPGININCYDVITHNGLLLVIGPSGFFQYDYSNINNITYLSQILKGQ